MNIKTQLICSNFNSILFVSRCRKFLLLASLSSILQWQAISTFIWPAQIFSVLLQWIMVWNQSAKHMRNRILHFQQKGHWSKTYLDHSHYQCCDHRLRFIWSPPKLLPWGEVATHCSCWVWDHAILSSLPGLYYSLPPAVDMWQL